MSVVSVRSVTKSYRGRPLYRDATFDIVQGTITALTGPNGSGKSVLFRLLCGFVQPDAGTVTIDPRFLSARRTFPDRFGVVIDRPAYIAGKTGFANLQELADIRGLIDADQIKATMRLLGLDPDLKQKVRHYSLGMKQKLALAQAFMEDPAVLVLDEPFNALDADSVRSLRGHLLELNEAGVTIIFTSHNQDDVDELATHRLVIANETVSPA